MAGRILDRRALRKQAEEAEQPQGEAVVATVEAPALTPKKGKRKAAAAPKVKKPRKVKKPPRQRALWGVFDGGMKRVAIFDYNQRAAAEEKVADLLATKKGTHFLQMVKEPMPEPAEEAAPVG
jgi:hypothetical protein